MKKIIIDVNTQEEIIVDYSIEELAQYEFGKTESDAKEQAEAERLAAEEQAQLDAEAKAAAKAAVLAKLGLTEEEINTFLA